MKFEEKRKDWLNYFKLSVTQARDARLSGDIEKACMIDQTVEMYYQEAKDEGYYDEEFLHEVESDIRHIR